MRGSNNPEEVRLLLWIHRNKQKLPRWAERKRDMEKERTMTNKELKLPFQNAQEFVVWAREALARKKAITDKIQSDWDEYSKKRSNNLATV